MLGKDKKYAAHPSAGGGVYPQGKPARTGRPDLTRMTPGPAVFFPGGPDGQLLFSPNDPLI